MNNKWQDQTIGQTVARLPAAAELFKANRIDFCCGGDRLLGAVLREQNIPDEAIYPRLDELAENLRQTADQKNFTTMATDELTNYIEASHHAYMHEALPQISEILAVVLKAHGRSHPDLFKLHGLYGQLRTDLEQHLIKEETLLFPMLDEADPADSAAIAALTLEIKNEHEAAGKLLKAMRLIAADYIAPPDACPTYQRLLDGLAEMEGDLFQHIHLENNILFNK